MAAARNIYLPINGKNEIILDENWVHNIFENMLGYHKNSIGEIIKDFVVNDYSFNQWYSSDYSLSIRRKLKTIFGNLGNEVYDLEFTLNRHDSDSNGENYRKSYSNTTRGLYKLGGLHGIIRNLIEFTTEISSNRLSRTSGSANNGNVVYTIGIKRMKPSSVGVLRDLLSDRKVLLENKRVLELFNPTNMIKTYCASQVLEYCMKKHGLNYFNEIPDKAMGMNEFLNLIKRFVEEKPKKLLKKIVVWKLKRQKSSFKLELVYPTNKPAYHTKLVELVIHENGSHVYIKQPDEKKRKIDNITLCPLCRGEFESRFLAKHVKSCEIARSRELDNIHVKEREYPIKKYTVEDLLNMDKEAQVIFNICKTEIEQNQSMYINGPAGNGKTHLIKRLCFEIPGHKWVIAPTGVVAADYKNIGSTIHSKFNFFQIMGIKPLEYWFTHPEQFEEIVKKQFRNKWIERPRFIVIEECSMVTGKMIKFISECLKMYYNSDQDFASIPVLFTGDPGQMEPIDDKNGIADLYFSCDEVARIRKHGCVLTLNHPRRLLLSGMDNSQVCFQFNILQEMRLGRLNPDFFNIVQTITPEEFFLQLENGEIEKNPNNVIFASTHEKIKFLLQKTYVGRELINVGKNVYKHDLYLVKGMKLMVLDNQAVNAQNVNNGTACWVVDWIVGKSVTIKTQDGKKHVVKKGQGSNVGQNQFALGPYFIRTPEKGQGMTIKGKLYLYEQSEKHSIDKRYGAGKFYTKMSRVTDLRNIIVVKDANVSLTNVFKEKHCWTYKSVCDVIKNPRAEISINTMVGSGGQIALRDTNSMTGFIQMSNKRIATKEGYHHDRWIMENEKRNNNTLFLDHETRINIVHSLKRHTIAYTSPLWIFKGKPCDFRDFITKNGGCCDDLPVYQIKSNGQMVFDDFYMDNPGQVLFEYLERLFKLICDKINTGDEKWVYESVDLGYFYHNPMIFAGFNNLGYDDRFFMQELLMSKTKLDPSFTHAGGSTLKSFICHYGNDPRKRIALKSWDIMLLLSIGTLDANVQKYVFENVDNIRNFMTIQSKLWKYGETPYGTNLLDDYDECDASDWIKLSESLKIEILTEWSENEILHRHYQGKHNYDMRIRNDKKMEKLLKAKAKEFVERCIVGAQRDEMLLTDLTMRNKKGTCALKLYTQLTREEIRENPIVDLIEIMKDDNGNLDFNRCFFDAEKGKKLFEEKGEDFFRNYDIHQEIVDYADNDVIITYLLTCIVDNKWGYEFGYSLDEFSFKKSWNGLGLSIFRFNTMCKYTLQLTTDMMVYGFPDAFFNGPDKSLFYTKFPVMPLDVGEIIKKACGGKTQVRAPFFKTSDGGLFDYYVYLDVSGMYMKAQMENEYPYGHVSIWTNVFQEKLDDVVNQYNSHKAGDKSSIWRKCRFFEFKGHCHPKEVENVCGIKGKFRLNYTNETVNYVMSNYELEMFKLSGGTIVEMKTIIEWEFQGQLFKRPMEYYAKQKANASDEITRLTVKLLANATFGAYNQKDKHIKMVSFKNSDDAHFIYNKHPGGVKNLRFVKDRYIGHVEDTEATNCYKPSYIGAFTLGASKPMLYRPLLMALGGETRFENIEKMILYGDTDSIVIHRKALQRLIQHDLKVEEKDRILFNAGDNAKYKPGKFTDEPSDDIDKYLGKGVGKNYHASFPNLMTGFHSRIVEEYNPQSKTGAVMIKIPPFKWNDGRICTKNDYPEIDDPENPWFVAYKAFIKGVSKYSELMLNDEERGIYMKIQGVEKNRESFEMIKHSVLWSIPIDSKRKGDIVKTILFPNKIQEEQGMAPFGIYNIEDPGRKVLGKINTGRIILLKPEFEKNSEGKKMSIEEWARKGVDAFTCSDGFSVPTGYKF